jgi:hypothetical protein
MILAARQWMLRIKRRSVPPSHPAGGESRAIPGRAHINPNTVHSEMPWDGVLYTSCVCGTDASMRASNLPLPGDRDCTAPQSC